MQWWLSRCQNQVRSRNWFSAWPELHIWLGVSISDPAELLPSRSGPLKFKLPEGASGRIPATGGQILVEVHDQPRALHDVSAAKLLA